ncbi:MAG: glycosyltransferase [Gammaproteobacteria bacterium]|nr:glycosyltransferase [Gammaproteobacteria bacterium]
MTNDKGQLIITVALKQELPHAWLAARNIPIHSLKALQSGMSLPDAGVLFVITGVGLAASAQAAAWISEQIQPRFAVNIGMAGSPRGRAGNWITPARVRCESGEEIELDTRLPFPWPENLERSEGGELLSVAEPLTDSGKACDIVDMEAFSQARVYAQAGICFSVLKYVSDTCDTDALLQFQQALPRMREQLQSVFSFLGKMSLPEISVVIPVYNRAAWIERCLLSVLHQSLVPREVIIVDDGSTDDLNQRLQKFSGRVRLISLSQNQGISHARNCGAAAACGDWLAFLDSDDLWERHKLRNQWRYLQRYPFYQALQSEEVWIRNGVRVNPCRHHAKPEGWIWTPSLARCLVSPSAILLRSELFRKLGWFDENLPACEDYDLWLRMARRYPVGLDPTPSVIKHGGHADQLSHAFPAMDRFRVYALMKALVQEKEPPRRKKLMEILKKKLSLLAGGARKRAKEAQADRYQALLARLACLASDGGAAQKGAFLQEKSDNLRWLINT